MVRNGHLMFWLMFIQVRLQWEHWTLFALSIYLSQYITIIKQGYVALKSACDVCIWEKEEHLQTALKEMCCCDGWQFIAFPLSVSYSCVIFTFIALQSGFCGQVTNNHISCQSGLFPYSVQFISHYLYLHPLPLSRIHTLFLVVVANTKKQIEWQVTRHNVFISSRAHRWKFWFALHFNVFIMSIWGWKTIWTSRKWTEPKRSHFNQGFSTDSEKCQTSVDEKIARVHLAYESVAAAVCNILTTINRWNQLQMEMIH